MTNTSFEKMLEEVCEHCDLRVNAETQEEADKECEHCWFAKYAHEILAEEDDGK